MKRLIVGLLVVVLALLAANSLQAYPVSAGDYIKISLGMGNAYGGGAFLISDPTTDAKLFYTFCLERNESFSYGGQYYINSITGAAVNGGIGGGNPDPISSETAYLYSQWSQKIITHTASNANALQLAIWAFEDEWTDPLAGTALTFYNDAVNNANGTLYGVGVINLYDNPRSMNPKQDLLVAPEPTSMLLLGFGLIGIAGLGLRFRK